MKKAKIILIVFIAILAVVVSFFVGFFGSGRSSPETSSITNATTNAGNAYSILYKPNYDSEWVNVQEGSGKVIISGVEPSRDGYEFKGWSKVVNSTVSEYNAGDVFNLTSDVTLFAVWGKLYTVYIDPDGGLLASNTGEAVNNNFSVSERSPLGSVLGNIKVTKEGCSFREWTVNGEPVPQNMPAQDITVKAEWDKICTVVIYHTETKIETLQVLSGSLLTLEEEPAKEGRRFVCWCTSEDGSGDLYEAGSIIINKNLKLYPVYRDLTYRITYLENGGSTPPEPQTGYGNINITTLTPERSGCVFKEWNTEPDGSGRGYQPGETVMLDHSLILYAVWTAENVPSGTLKITVKNETGYISLDPVELPANTVLDAEEVINIAKTQLPDTNFENAEVSPGSIAVREGRPVTAVITVAGTAAS